MGQIDQRRWAHGARRGTGNSSANLIQNANEAPARHRCNLRLSHPALHQGRPRSARQRQQRPVRSNLELCRCLPLRIVLARCPASPSRRAPSASVAATPAVLSLSLSRPSFLRFLISLLSQYLPASRTARLPFRNSRASAFLGWAFWRERGSSSAARRRHRFCWCWCWWLPPVLRVRESGHRCVCCRCR